MSAPRGVSWLRGGLLGPLVLVLYASASPVYHGDFDQKIAAVTEQLRASPRSSPLYARRAELHRLHGDEAACRADLAFARAYDPRSTEAFLVEARLLADLGRDPRALEAVRRALVQEPRLGPALVLQAELYARMGRFSDAVRSYSAALEVLPPTPELYVERARAEAAVGPEHVASALRGLEQGLRELPGVPALIYGAVDLERRLGRFDAALSRLRASTASIPAHNRAALCGHLLREGGRELEARRAFEEALRHIGALPPAKRRTPAIRTLATELRLLVNEKRPESPSEDISR